MSSALSEAYSGKGETLKINMNKNKKEQRKAQHFKLYDFKCQSVISDAKMVLTAVQLIEKLALARHKKSPNVFTFKL